MAGKKQIFDPLIHCGADANGSPCRNKKGFRTDHLGNGKCFKHGGLTPIKSGRYSSIERPRLKELIEKFEADEAPLDLLPELALLRALVLDFIERYDLFAEALLAWHASFSDGYLAEVEIYRTKLAHYLDTGRYDGDMPPDPPDPTGWEKKPRQILDIISVGKFIGDIAGITEKVNKRIDEKKNLINLSTMQHVFNQLGTEVFLAAEKAIHDPISRTAFLDIVDERWGTIRVDPAATATGAGVKKGSSQIN
jgi:hypothetical protein